jgi:hypothetical protein
MMAVMSDLKALCDLLDYCGVRKREVRERVALLMQERERDSYAEGFLEGYRDSEAAGALNNRRGGSPSDCHSQGSITEPRPDALVGRQQRIGGF